jgi:hypothetical protein
VVVALLGGDHEARYHTRQWYCHDCCVNMGGIFFHGYCDSERKAFEDLSSYRMVLRYSVPDTCLQPQICKVNFVRYVHTYTYEYLFICIHTRTASEYAYTQRHIYINTYDYQQRNPVAHVPCAFILYRRTAASGFLSPMTLTHRMPWPANDYYGDKNLPVANVRRFGYQEIAP